MITPVSIAVATATLLSVLTLAVGIKKLNATRWLLPATAAGDVSRKVTWVLAIVVFPFAWFLSFVVGGNFGGAFASRLSENLGISHEVLIPLGIGLGLFVCAFLLPLAAAFVGFVATRYVERLRA